MRPIFLTRAVMRNQFFFWSGLRHSKNQVFLYSGSHWTVFQINQCSWASIQIYCLWYRLGIENNTQDLVQCTQRTWTWTLHTRIRTLHTITITLHTRTWTHNILHKTYFSICSLAFSSYWNLLWPIL